MRRFISALALLLLFCLTACGKNEELPPAQTAATETPASYEKIISDMTTEQKIGQLFCVSFSGTELSESVKDFFREYSVGNVILFSKNIENAEQTAGLCRDIQSEITANTGIAAFIGTDQEGGAVVRITDGAVYYPGAMALAAGGSYDDIQKVGEYMGAELKALGINIDFAPVADVNSNPDNPVIGTRSFGSNPEDVGECSAAFINGMNASMEVSTAKHYPGHGDTDTDSHYGLPRVDKSLDSLMETELLPFKKLIENNVPAIMAAHIIYPQIDGENPASMSKILLTDVLRNKLGFNGMIVTDGLRMGAIADNFGTADACVSSINAGADILLTGSGGESEDLLLTPQIECIKRVREAVENGEITEETLDSAVLRILKCKKEYKIDQSGFSPLDRETLDEHRALAEEISRSSVTLVKDENGLLPIKEGESVLTISSGSVKRLDESDTEALVSMAEYMAERTGGDAKIIPDNMNESETESFAAVCRDEAADYDKVIVCANRKSHAEIINAVIEGNPETIAVSLGTPYLLRELKDCGTFLCAYEYTPYSVEGTAEVILGEETARGILPVGW